MLSPLVFVPPSDTKAEGGETSFLHGHGRYRELASWRERVLAALEKAMKGNASVRESVLKLKGDALAEATQKNLGLREADLTRPAVERFRGGIYESLDWASLPESSRRRLQEHVAIVDPLYGLLAPGDEIPDYRLSSDAVLPDLGKLSDFWREAVALALSPLKGRREFWDVLPDAQRRAMPKDIPVDLQIEFVDIVGGEDERTGVAGKVLKGMMLRHLATAGFTHEALRAFTFDGYAFDEGRSRPRLVVFSKAFPARPKPAKEEAPAAAPAKAAKSARPAKAAKAKEPAAKSAKAKPARKAPAKAARTKPAKKPARRKAKA